MAGTLRRLGFTLFALLIAVYLISQMVEIPGAREVLTTALFSQIAALCVLMIVVGFVLPVLGGAAGVVAGKRCPRCGKRVEKNQIYCRDHQKAAIDEMRDRQRNFDDSSIGKRKK